MHIILATLFLASNPTGLCYFTGSEVTDMTQQCRYSCLQGDVTITIDALDMCPLSLPEE